MSQKQVNELTAFQEFVEETRNEIRALGDRLSASLGEMHHYAEDSKSMDDTVGIVQRYVEMRVTSEVLHNMSKFVSEQIRRMEQETIPDHFDRKEIKTFKTIDGVSITATELVRASIKSGRKDEAFEWLRSMGSEDVIQSTVNASTLSALVRSLLEQNVDVDDEVINVYTQRGVSVRGLKKT